MDGFKNLQTDWDSKNLQTDWDSVASEWEVHIFEALYIFLIETWSE